MEHCCRTSIVADSNMCLDFGFLAHHFLYLLPLLWLLVTATLVQVCLLAALYLIIRSQFLFLTIPTGQELNWEEAQLLHFDLGQDHLLQEKGCQDAFWYSLHSQILALPGKCPYPLTHVHLARESATQSRPFSFRISFYSSFVKS